MQDRVPLYPGRVVLTPVSGQTNTYDLVRADQPQQEGTPLNKNSLLKDATAALFGLDENAVPNDVFGVLSKAAVIREKYTKVTTADQLPVGSVISLNVDGVPKDFIVVHQGKPSSLYDDSCNGTWLLMKDVYVSKAWHTSASNIYSASSIHAYLNGTFPGLLDTNVQAIMKQAKIPYVNGTGSGGSVASGANGLAAKAFLLSGYELGWTTSNNQYFPVDGAALSYFSGGASRIAFLDGTATNWWLRSAYKSNATHAWLVNPSGSYATQTATTSFGIRPAIIVSGDISTFGLYTDGSMVHTEQAYGLNSILGGMVGPQIATGSYTGTDTYGSANPNSLTFDFEPKFVWIYALSSGYGLKQITQYSSGSDYVVGNFIVPDLLTTEYTKYVGPYNQGQGSYAYGKKSADGKTMSWYNTQTASQQLNVGGTVYHYFAIG